MTVIPSLENMNLDILQETRVAASIEETFAALLDELGPLMLGMEDAPMPMVLEARPGGRWYRDLGNDDGHYWGTVKAIRKPNLLEIYGPLMMSFPVASNLQYRLKVEGNETVITLRHTALGLFPEGFRDNVTEGWTDITQRVQSRFSSTN
jgi:uncharacterized protein YndB with AHSA1/START domain